jgi:hypothetical protein
VKKDLSLPRFEASENGLQEGRFTGTVRSYNRDYLTGFNLNGYIVENIDFTVPSGDPLGF